jgi:hypothetical protein
MAEKNRTHSFVVRIWQEHCDQPKAIWSGRVEDVSSGDFVFFRRLEQLLSFMRERSGATPLFGQSREQPAENAFLATVRRFFRRGRSS